MATHPVSTLQLNAWAQRCAPGPLCRFVPLILSNSLPLPYPNRNDSRAGVCPLRMGAFARNQ